MNGSIDMPPLGCRPRFVIEKERALVLLEKAHEYVRTNHVFPTDWISELMDMRTIHEPSPLYQGTYMNAFSKIDRIKQ